MSEDYDDFNEFCRYRNLDCIEGFIVNHLVDSKTKFANNIWKLLKYNDINALSQPDVTKEERWNLVCNSSGDQTKKRVFISPFIDDAWTEECASIYIYVDHIEPVDHLQSRVYVTVEVISHAKCSVIAGDGDPVLSPDTANSLESDEDGNLLVTFKNRETVLLKSIMAELNGLAIGGVGLMQMNNQNGLEGKVSLSSFNHRSYYGHSATFVILMAGISERLTDEPPYNAL